MIPPISTTEVARVAALHRYQVLDTPREDAYDDLVTLAAQLCDAPIALVSLLDDKRQWFKAKVGLDVDETSRDVAFCSHTILKGRDQIFEIPDATADPRFQDNSLVTGAPHVRFYAGVPLTDSRGHALGTLCVLDKKTRTLTEVQKANLRVLARQVVSQLEFRLRGLELDEKAEVCHTAELELKRRESRLATTESEGARLLDLAEQSRRALLTILEDEQKASHELQRSNRALRMWSSCNEAVIWAKDERSLLERICRIAVELGEHSMAFVAYAKDDANKTVMPMAHSGDDPGYLSEVTLTWDENQPGGKGPVGECIREGKPIVCRDLRDSAALSANVLAAAKRGYHGIVCLPLRDSYRTFGLLGLSSPDLGEMGDAEVKLLQEVADDLAFGIGALRTRAIREQAELDLRTSLKDKEALLKEVHHRVKNNLQVIGSLLSLEGRRIQHQVTKDVLREMQGRIQSMALLHETIYRSGTFAKVDLAAYLRKLVNQLFRTVSVSAVQFHVDLARADVEMDQAIPCGLIVNELVTNGLKHGLSDGSAGEMWITLVQSGQPPELTISVRNSGPPLPEGFDPTQKKGLGLQLVSDLTRQLHGTFTVECRNPPTFAVRFKPTEAHISEGTRLSREGRTQLGRIES